MNVLVVSHTYLTPINRAKWDALKRSNPEYTITILTPDTWHGGVYRKYSQSDNTSSTRCISLKAYKAGNELLYFFSPLPLAKLIRSIKPNIIHVEQGPSSLAYLQIMLTARLCGLKPKQLFFTWINWKEAETFKMRIWNASIRKLNLTLSDGAIAGNHDAVKILHDNGFKKPVYVLPQLGVDMHTFAPATTAPNKKIIGFVGRFVPEKGISMLLNVFQKLAAEYPEWELLLVGAGPEETKIRAYITKNSLSHRVFITQATHIDVAEHMRKMSIFVLPSYDTPYWREQFGHVLIEAMACKIAVLGSNAGEIPYVLAGAGSIFEQKNEASLLAELERLMQDEQLRKIRALSGFEKVQREYSNEVIGCKTASFWSTLT